MFSAAQIAIRMFASGLILLAAEAAWGQFLPLAVVADTSTEVPGGTPGEVFSTLEGLSLSSSNVAFRGVGKMGTDGIYTNVGGALTAVADTSTEVPGGSSGEHFSRFGPGFGIGPSLSGGSVSFLGEGEFGTQGIYTNVGGTLTAVADTRTEVPGGLPGEVFAGFGRSSLAGGSVVFNGRGNMGTQGIYTNADGALAAVADTSTPVPDGLPGEVFSWMPPDTFGLGFPSSSGGNVAFAGEGDMGTKGIYTEVGGTLAAVADTSTPVPGGATGELFSSLRGSRPSLSGSSVAFFGGGDMGAQGIYSDRSGALAAVADVSTSMPSGATGELFSSFGNSPSLSGSSAAFAGSGDMGTSGIYTDLGGALAAVADTAIPVPGGATGELFSFFGNPSLSGGNVAFIGGGDMGTRGIYFAAEFPIFTDGFESGDTAAWSRTVP